MNQTKISNKHNKLESSYTVFMLVYLSLQPVLDLYFLFDRNFFSIGGVTLPTFVRYVMMMIMLLYSIYYISRLDPKRRRKILIPLFIWILLFCIYIFAHVNFGENYNAESIYGFSTKVELVYYVNMIMNILVIYFIYISKPSTYFNRTIKVWTFLVPGTIVLLNLFKISISSYTNKPIAENFIYWFTSNPKQLSYLQLSSKGLFRYANQISLVLSITLPFAALKLFKKVNILNWLSVFLYLLSMAMIGTRVAYYSFPLMFIMTYIVFLVLNRTYIQKKVNFKRLLSILMLCGIFIFLAPYTPSNQRQKTTQSIVEKEEKQIDKVQNNTVNDIEEESEVKISDNQNSEGSEKSPEEIKIESIERIYPTRRITPIFIENLYSYKIDPDFWIMMLDYPDSKLMDQRFIEFQILNRVKQLNNNPLESLFGMGNSRMHNLFPLERDFVSHFFSIGVLGIVFLLGQYILLPFFLIHYLFNRKKINLDDKTVILFGCLIFSLIISVYSGNIMDSMFPTTIIAFLYASFIECYLNCMSYKQDLI